MSVQNPASRAEVTRPIRVLLVNQHPIIRANLRQILERAAHVHVMAEASNGGEAVSLAQYQKPDVVVLDFQLPVFNGIETVRKLGVLPDIRSLFTTVLADEEYVLEAFKAGARGFVLNQAAQTDLLPAIRVVAAGGVFLSPPIRSALVHHLI